MARGTYHCFGCQEGGDAISFLMKLDGLSFVETVERLAEKYGVELKREEGDGADERPRGPGRGPGKVLSARARELPPDRAARCGGRSPAGTEATAVRVSGHRRPRATGSTPPGVRAYRPGGQEGFP